MSEETPKNIGLQYVGWADGFLTEKLGRAPEFQELAEFAEAVGSILLGSMYVLTREQIGPEQAETWLKKTLALASSEVRSQGADVLLKFDVTIKDAPNKLGKRRPFQMAAAPEGMPIACACNLDGEGRCAYCTDKLAQYFKSILEPFRQLITCAKDVKDLCKICQTAQTDYAMSLVIQAFPKSAIANDEMLIAFHSMAGLMGVRELPLTDNAWKTAKGTLE